ncbi:disease resistance RPP13-like protein 4 [Corylus avellana]|uniref:disease resistance RPP13-like protein 4 n=1 Tax=Corylus avellana TaxID=13451 RepID=UPI001E20A08B|nr:disease resistance RPP13-like protein 4 [Corylus avellana]XP_059437966.1 disease resistance RPP13-like protein 4 [Corylus avellana]XP_059437967.1 disease resistance RPP13-like protein 4 [Corylus avellana]
MSSSDQSSGAGSVAESKDSVISDVVKSLKQAKVFLSQNRPPVSSDINSGNNNGDSGNDGSSHTSQDDYQRMENQAEKLSKDLIYIGESFKSLEGFEVIAIDLLKKLVQHSSDALGTSVPNVSSRPKQFQAKLRAIDKIVMELKLRIPLPYKLSSDKSDAHRYARGGTEFDDLDVIDDLPVLHVDVGFKNSLAFQDFRSVYESLDPRTKLCLLCFALIPGNEIVKKRFMTYWWVGEGFVSPQVEEADEGNGTFKKLLSVEEVADGIFKELAKKDCIEPVNEKHRFVVDTYKMNPFIRSAVIFLAKEAGLFDFDDKKWNPTTNFKTSHRAYLVNGFSQELVKFFNESATEKRGAELDLEKLQTIFNVNEPYPDFFKSEWFSKLKNVKVLYLGRWQTSAKHHIEVESVEFLKGLKNMKLLRFLSLQGISRITKLPDSVCKLLNLRILDLRACHTLEELPDGIGSLENLTHLDISECYLLEYIPKKIKFLSKLRVLKGFVIGDRRNEKACTLTDLSGLKELRKLSIYTNTKDFPNEDDENNLQKFENLEKLTIEWGAFPSNTGSDPYQDKGEPQSMTPTTTSSKKRDKKRQGESVAQPISATTTSPKNGGNNQKQDKGAAQPLTATITTPKNRGGNKNQDQGVAEPMTGSTMNPENSGDNKKKDKRAAGLVKTLSKSLTFKQRGRGPIYPKVFEKLKKLDLKCYPSMQASSWLLPAKLPMLKKLYIRGGNLQNLSPGQKNDKWKVNILRLKFLSNLRMDWKELQLSFPELTYLEKYKCPKLTFFPSNENGIVLKP